MALQEDENTWILELEAALLDTEVPSASDIYAICKGQPIPTNLRPDVWQACLYVTDRRDQLSQFNEVYDLPEQNIIRDDCQQLVAKLGNDDEDKVSVVSDLESILTFYCKSKCKQYERGNGWIELLGPLIALKLPRAATYNLFEAIRDIYIPRGETYSSVLRLLLLYHEPELCSFLDTKRISPDQYTKIWMNTLFAGVCSLPAICTMWDLYFMQADPFFMLFLSLIMIINAREQILSMKDEDKQNIIDAIAIMPCALEAEDVTDFCSLAQYYAMKTPTSFKQDLYPIMFGENSDEKSISHALCLPVSAQELVENAIEAPSIPNTVETVRFFLVDCRPAEQYNAGHLPTAFHLDCNLMLQEPAAFATAVQGLLQAQRQALAVGSQAGGEHLCFLGSGRQEEDRYTHMVVASFLQKHTQYVSMITSGYQAIHEYFGDEVVSSLVDHNSQHCLVCNTNMLEENSNEASPVKVKNNNSDLLGKIGLAMKLKSQEVKGKLFDYIVNPTANVNSNTEKNDGKDLDYIKRQRKTAPVFSIDDDQEIDSTMTNNESEEPIEVVSVQQWMKNPNLLHSFKCQEVKVNGDLCDR
ncbi:TBC1 domain family member 23 isoform X2 [Camponotus floridanus]|uniref:TBC1 domain family member 23 isoform X2 n=1 Tax=Camponotus floridanus TaxID=104421 RepID=UPI000DC6B8A1|nr:TBC1 domain family member 23 isoform X2 [Camponotus floridanus]